MSNLKIKAQLLSKLYYSFARWKIWGRFMKNYRFPPLSNVQCVLNQEFPFFWFTSIGVQKRPVLVEVSAPMRLALRGSHVQRLYRKQTPLRSKSSTIKGLLYARLSSRCKAFVARNVRTIAWAKREKAVIRQATNAIYGMGTLKLPLRSIRHEEGPHYCLGAKRKEAVIRQAINAIWHGYVESPAAKHL
jgi:hypothetical protein